MLEKELDCVFIRINRDEENFNIFKEINKIYRYIKKLTKNDWLMIFQQIARIRI